jgi:hypothetical protein
MAVSKGRSARTKDDFSAEIPCYRELTGNFAFFGMSDSGHIAREARNSAVFQSEPAFRNREFEIVEQGIRIFGTGNTKTRNREYEKSETEKSESGNSKRIARQDGIRFTLRALPGIAAKVHGLISLQ